MVILQQACEYNFFVEKNPFKEHRFQVKINWNKLPTNTIKLNINGAFFKATLEAGLGGVFRNKDGDWIFRYCRSAYASSVMHCELMALHEGLNIAKHLDLCNIEIEIDSTDSILMLNENNPNLSNLILECRLLVYQLKHPILRHNFREGNEIAHLLAKEALKNFKISRCVHHARPPCFVEHQLLKEKHGFSFKLKYVSTSVCEKLAKFGN
ncbi:uncharacterized protein [Nicotiana sylvestris]|uniref:Uncharacterized protein LOC104239517 n=1 Tax=Nicotiana sylvestris TaxID=4096 RepID=A0A1U7XNI2_NICSY|nr:PREDICTED: uncharacterized protein LOC104239517 [Nicotiana sylvestris]